MLDPVELGRVRFELTTVNDRVHVNLSVERSDTLDLLRRNADSLRAELRDAGFDGSSLNFSQWNQRGSEGQAPVVPGSDLAFDAPVRPDDRVAAPNLNTATGQGLHLRL